MNTNNNVTTTNNQIQRYGRNLALTSLLLPLGIANSVMAAPPAHSAAFAKSQILVQPAAGLSEEKFSKMLGKHGAKIKGKLAKLRTRVISVPAQAEQAIVKALSKNPNIEFAELDLLVKPSLITANDPYYNNAWHLAKMQLPTAWESSKGNGVVVAVLDSGVDGNHTDLAINMVPGWNSVSKNTDTSDVNGHGTKVAGVVAAASNNASGVTSIAWNSSIMPVRITNDSGGYAYWSDVASGLIWAADHGADIANVSYKVSKSSTVTNAAQYMRSKGGLVVASAGNNGSDLNCSDNASIITVSATDSSDNKTSWSDYGNCVDVAAPGAGIWSTTKGGGYGAVSGTSFASPATAAVLALLKSANPNLSNDELENILETSADKTKNGGEFSSYYGHGRVDAAAAVAMIQQTPTVDQQAPTVAITSPAENSSQNGVFNIATSAQDNIGVTAVTLYADGALVGTDTVAPFSFSFDSNNVANGNVAFTAYAYDAAANQGSSSTHWLSIDNVVDTSDIVAPTVAITSPVENSSQSGVFNIMTSAQDNVGVTMVKLYANGALVATDTAAPFSFSFDSSTVADGDVAFTAYAYDAEGNQGKSSSHRLSIDNVADVADTIAPSLQITEPVDGSTVSRTITIRANASDNVGVSNVSLYIDGKLKTQTSGSSLYYRWSTRKATPGLHSITIKASDAAGNLTERRVQVTTVGRKRR